MMNFYISEIRRICLDNKSRYGMRKVWRQMKANDIRVARCMVKRLMTQYELQGIWSRKGKITTNCRDSQKRAEDLVNCNFNVNCFNQI